MVECDEHPGRFHIPGDECVSCAAERRSAEVRERAAKEAAAAVPQKKGKK